MRNDNNTLAITSLSRAYVACETGEYDRAMRHLQLAATYAWLAGDLARHAACIKARAKIAVATGVRHLSAVEG